MADTKTKAKKPRTKKVKPAPIKALSALAGLKAQLLSSTSMSAVIAVQNASAEKTRRLYDDGPTTLTRSQMEYALHRAGA